MFQTYRFDLDSVISKVSSGAWNVGYNIKNQLSWACGVKPVHT